MTASERLLIAEEKLNHFEAASEDLQDATYHLRQAGYCKCAAAVDGYREIADKNAERLMEEIKQLRVEAQQEADRELEYQNREYEWSV